MAQSAPHKAPGWRRARGATARTRRERRAPAPVPVPVPERGRLTDVPLDGDLLDACPLGAGGGRRAEPLGRGGHAWLATARARDAGARLCWELGAEASRSRRRDPHFVFDFGARRLGGWAGPRSGHAPAAPTPTLHASPSPARAAGTVAPPGQPGAPGRRGQGRALRCELVGGQGRGLRDELIRRQGVGLNSVSPSPRVRLGGLNSAGKKSRK